MNPVLTFLHFIKLAYIDINAHKSYRDHASHRTMMYSYGRVIGAYELLDVKYKTPDICTKRNHLEECYLDAMGLTIRKD